MNNAETKTFRLETSAKIDGSCTNVRFATGPTAPEMPGNWIECDDLELDLSGFGQLYKQGEHRFFGRL